MFYFILYSKRTESLKRLQVDGGGGAGGVETAKRKALLNLSLLHPPTTPLVLTLFIDPKLIETRLTSILSLYLANVALLFVFEGDLPRSSYVLPLRQLALVRKRERERKKKKRALLVLDPGSSSSFLFTFFFFFDSGSTGASGSTGRDRGQRLVQFFASFRSKKSSHFLSPSLSSFFLSLSLSVSLFFPLFYRPRTSSSSR